jgi:AcrR family transcriptional regulator
MTVEAVLDAVVRILKSEGFEALTTNHIAEVAGVSIGPVYQYFPDKRAIFAALHERHIREIDRLVESKLMEHAASPLDTLMRAMIEAMIEAMIDAHTPDRELYELLSTEVPHRAEGTRDFAVRLHGAFRLAIAARVDELKKRRDIDTVVFVVTHMAEALSHGAVLRRALPGCHSPPPRTRRCAPSWPICTRKAACVSRIVQSESETLNKGRFTNGKARSEHYRAEYNASRPAVSSHHNRRPQDCVERTDRGIQSQWPVFLGASPCPVGSTLPIVHFGLCAEIS